MAFNKLQCPYNAKYNKSIKDLNLPLPNTAMPTFTQVLFDSLKFSAEL